MIAFPCHFPIKIIFSNQQFIADKVIGILYRHYPNLRADAIKQNVSSNNNYCSITVRVFAQNQAELDSLYSELSRESDIKMVL